MALAAFFFGVSVGKMNRSMKNQMIDRLNGELHSQGYECIEMQWDASDSTLRLFIDRLDGQPVSVEDCVAVDHFTDQCSWFVESVPGEFVLEVSSPGIDRPLRTVSHFEKVLGLDVSVKLERSHQMRKAGQGKLVEISGDGVVKLLTKRGEWAFPVLDLDEAQLLPRNLSTKRTSKNMQTLA